MKDFIRSPYFAYVTGTFLGYGVGSGSYLEAAAFTVAVVLIVFVFAWILVGSSIFKRNDTSDNQKTPE